ncbi:beta-lactamase/transpeptidase-like protein [Podospora didyma]|uniref:Beta-lactamase/transpeptidase-like protein n=1 Tax=Podospora didyma TaxID=330526 RepID=A0AAE0P5L9_9PEZI|nr:beta-lactamase/transpeptidase-like protein [Podospora didyma]
MKQLSFHTAALLLSGLAYRLCSAQNCPIAGPAYPAVTKIAASPALKAIKTALDSVVEQAFVSGQLDRSETVYRIGSVSKILAVYAILSKLSHKHWQDSITDYIPELANAPPPRSAVDSVEWSKVTLGALASHMAGIGQGYAIGELLPAGLPGLPVLNESSLPQCGIATSRPCTRAEALELILQKPPVTSTYHTPIYSNMAFQLLAYAVESITGEAFATLVDQHILKPLSLTRTFLSTPPLDDSNVVIADGFARDMGDEAPAGGYFQSIADLSALGKSILGSTLLPADATRQWLRPVTHSANVYHSIGRPWEIDRQRVPISPPSSSSSSSATRVVDLYTKGGGIGQYASLLALSPDHDMGISILASSAAGPSSSPPQYGILASQLTATWLRIAEQASREQAASNFVGTYSTTTLAAEEEEPLESLAEFSLLPNEPGLFLSRLVSNGTDMLGLLGPLLLGGSSSSSPDFRLGAWLYPTGLVKDNNRIAFRAVFGAVGGVPGSEEACTSATGTVDALRYGPYSLDLFIFHLADDGGTAAAAPAVEIPGLQRVLRRER